MGRLVIVSNRVPALDNGDVAGGLAVGVDAALEEAGGLWLGWSGQVAGDGRGTIQTRQAGTYTLATFDLSKSEHDGYYASFANRALWPLLHGRSDLIRFDENDYCAYGLVARKFARHLASLIEPGDRIWVHDFHLFLLGSELRRAGIQNPTGFFLHTPFPPSDIAAMLPRHQELFRGLADFDLVGFQTTNDLHNFHDYVGRELGGSVDPDGVASIGGRRFATGAFPIGIDSARFAALATSPEARQLSQRLAGCFDSGLGVIGAERLDYTKGLPERLRAFEHLLSCEPAYQGQAFLIQVAAPSRESVPEYVDLKQELDALSGAINARFGTVAWTPVRYINRAVSQVRLAALYRLSRVGLVTPLRDGMNLVAKEFVAAQDEADPGVLVLSQFAGAAEQLEAALIVNPYDIEGTAGALKRALEMPLAERRARWRDLMDQVENHDIHAWWKSFLKALSQAVRIRTSLFDPDQVKTDKRTIQPAGEASNPLTLSTWRGGLRLRGKYVAEPATSKAARLESGT